MLKETWGEYAVLDKDMGAPVGRNKRRGARDTSRPRGQQHPLSSGKEKHSGREKAEVKAPRWGIAVAVGLVFCALAIWLKMRSCKPSS